MTRALIADDEPLMREQLRARLSELWPELEIVAEAKNGVEAVEQVVALRPEVVFLDIRMPAKTGIEAAREIAALDGRLPEIVFVTAYDQYAIDAFEQGVIDYVLIFVADEKYTRVQTAQQEALIRKPIKELLAELDPAQFWQIHRSTLINTRAIAGIFRDERGRQLVAVKGRPEKLEVSRSYAHLFKGM